MMLLFVPKN